MAAKAKSKRGRLFVFAYGSLMVPRSASRAIGRTIDVADMRPAYLEGFERCWRARAPLWSSDLKTEIAGLFLDLRATPGACVNGILIEISEDELVPLRMRESQYYEVDVTANLRNPKIKGRAISFVSAPKARRNIPGIQTLMPSRYLSRIEKACRMLGVDFLREFHRTTRPTRLPSFSGRYRFLDPKQAKKV